MKPYRDLIRFLNFFYLVGGAFSQAQDFKKSFPNPMVIGHRGCAGLYPENTLIAFEKAIDLGVHAIELDVHYTKDGHVIVYHDTRLNPEMTRDTKGKWISQTPFYVRDMTLSQLRQYTVGEVKPGSSYESSHPFLTQVKNQRIPLLSEVFDLAKRKRASDLEFFVELKTSPLPEDYASDREDLIVATLKDIQKAGVADRTHILCFDSWSLDRVRALAPEMKTTYLMERGLSPKSPWMAWFQFASFKEKDLPKLVCSKGVSCWSPEFWNRQLQYLQPEHVKAAHEAGLQVIVWTPNDPVDLQKMIDIGVDGITTDRPDILRGILKNTSEKNREQH